MPPLIKPTPLCSVHTNWWNSYIGLTLVFGLWSFFFVCLCLCVSGVTTGTRSVSLSCFCEILIISPPSLLASALIDWQEQSCRNDWRVWMKAKEEEKKEPAHQVHQRQSPAPSSPYKSQCLIPLVYHLLLHSPFTAPLSLHLVLFPSSFFFLL